MFVSPRSFRRPARPALLVAFCSFCGEQAPYQGSDARRGRLGWAARRKSPMSPAALLFAAAVFAGEGGAAGAPATPAGKPTRVALETSKGRIVLELDAA